MTVISSVFWSIVGSVSMNRTEEPKLREEVVRPVVSQLSLYLLHTCEQLCEWGSRVDRELRVVWTGLWPQVTEPGPGSACLWMEVESTGEPPVGPDTVMASLGLHACEGWTPCCIPVESGARTWQVLYRLL